MTLLLTHRWLSLLLCSLWAVPTLANIDLPKTQRWSIFYRAALEQQSTPLVASQTLNQYPFALLSSHSQYPDFTQYTWQDIADLAATAKQCQPRNSSSPYLAKAVEFELALCRQTPLGAEWFQRVAWQHPAGGSYADRYIEHLPDSEQASFASTHPTRFTLASRYHPLHTLWQRPGAAGVDALLNGFRLYLAPNDELWLSSEAGWHVLSSVQWRALTAPLPFTIGVLLAFGAALRSLWLRYQEGRERRFILQLLTHELRTPITSLGFTVESLRSQFDELSPKAQESLWRLMADHQRLAQLSETSRHYLSPSHDSMARHPAQLSDFIEHCIEGFEVELHLKHDSILALPYYWLGLCVTNLLSNAKQHGVPPIRLTVSAVAQTLRIEVEDCGEFPSFYQRLYKRFSMPRSIISRPSPDNMGVGLQLVRKLITQMGGKLVIRRHPTRCILELPL
ncbi:DUF3404 domain-containing protein [Vibrio cholerae]|uniref:ATP-binding protein n=1 Tax=Vibrio cholerae TaxID=666 RepID=UPI000E09E1C0|nr:DUF3404 domain-containing protein [Vibrio cholerae]